MLFCGLDRRQIVTHSDFDDLDLNYTPWLPADRDAAVLDVGCGPGRVLAFLAARGCAVTRLFQLLARVWRGVRRAIDIVATKIVAVGEVPEGDGTARGWLPLQRPAAKCETRKWTWSGHYRLLGVPAGGQNRRWFSDSRERRIHYHERAARLNQAE